MNLRLLPISLLLALAACSNATPADPPLAGAKIGGPFQLIDQDGRAITDKAFAGKYRIMYFGYTYCPDVCPTTAQTIGAAMRLLDKSDPALSAKVVPVFVTVDPDRDTLAVLKSYVGAFAPQIEGMRTTPDALTALARRYRIAYSVTPESPGHPYEVTHSAAVYVFDGTGAARLLIPSMGSQTPDIAGTTADLRRLIAGGRDGGIVSRVMGYIEGLV